MCLRVSASTCICITSVYVVCSRCGMQKRDLDGKSDLAQGSGRAGNGCETLRVRAYRARYSNKITNLLRNSESESISRNCVGKRYLLATVVPPPVNLCPSQLLSSLLLQPQQLLDSLLTAPRFKFKTIDYCNRSSSSASCMCPASAAC